MRNGVLAALIATACAFGGEDRAAMPASRPATQATTQPATLPTSASQEVEGVVLEGVISSDAADEQKLTALVTLRNGGRDDLWVTERLPFELSVRDAKGANMLAPGAARWVGPAIIGGPDREIGPGGKYSRAYELQKLFLLKQGEVYFLTVSYLPSMRGELGKGIRVTISFRLPGGGEIVSQGQAPCEQASQRSAVAEGITLTVRADPRYRVGREMPVAISLFNNRNKEVLLPQWDPADRTYRIEMRTRSGLHVRRTDPRETGRGHGFARIEAKEERTEQVDLNAVFIVDKPGEYLVSVVGTIILGPGPSLRLQAPDVPVEIVEK